jgi:hypothetical protein
VRPRRRRWDASPRSRTRKGMATECTSHCCSPLHARSPVAPSRARRSRHGGRTRGGSCPPRSPLGLLPGMKRLAVGDVETRGKSPWRGDPADGPSRARGPLSRPPRGQLPTQAASDKDAEGGACFSRALLGAYQQVVGQVNRRLHMGKHITILPYCQGERQRITAVAAKSNGCPGQRLFFGRRKNDRRPRHPTRSVFFSVLTSTLWSSGFWKMPARPSSRASMLNRTDSPAEESR